MAYNFPVTNPIEAIRVTNPDFSVDILSQNLYVDLDDVRGTGTIDSICTTLGIINNTLTLTSDYVKIIFSGHRGCGKTSELQRLHQKLNKPNLYSSIFISIEEETELARFQPEDLYLLLLLKLLDFIQEKNININRAGIEALSKQLFSNEEIKKELKTYARGEAAAEQGVGLDFFGWLKAKINFKAVFGADNTTSREVREIIRRNLVKFVNDINALLVDIRDAMQRQNIGQDLLFIIDGSEKIPPEVYENIFVRNANVLKELSCNMVLSTSISMWYKIDSQAQFTNRELLPMLKMDNPATVIHLQQVLAKRLDVTGLFEQNAVKELLTHSGGCLRQLFILCNYALINAKGNKIKQTGVEYAISREGQRLYESLDEKHLTIIRDEEAGINPLIGNPEVSRMLYGLILLKYNGNCKVNPVVTHYMRHHIK